MKGIRQFATILTMLAGVAFLVGCTATETGTTRAAMPHLQTAKAKRAQVYLFRGLADVFSLGINDMAAELRRQGVPAHARGWTAEDAVLATIKKAYAKNRRGPIILAGHSLGAGTSFRIAQALTAEGIPVNLVIVMDMLSSPPVPKGIRRFISYKASGDRNESGSFKGAPGFRGRLINVDIRSLPDLDNAGHLNMVYQPEFQERVVKEILRAYRRG